MADGDAVSDRATRGVSVCRDVCPIFTVIVWILSFITLTVRWMLHRARVVRRPLARLERRASVPRRVSGRGVVSLGTLLATSPPEPRGVHRLHAHEPPPAHRPAAPALGRLGLVQASRLPHPGRTKLYRPARGCNGVS